MKLEDFKFKIGDKIRHKTYSESADGYLTVVGYGDNKYFVIPTGSLRAEPYSRAPMETIYEVVPHKFEVGKKYKLTKGGPPGTPFDTTVYRCVLVENQYAFLMYNDGTDLRVWIAPVKMDFTIGFEVTN